MEIKNHRLVGIGIKHLISPNTSGLIKSINYGIVHDDEGASMAGTESWIMNPAAKVSYHVLVGKKGEVTQFVDFNKRAWHAGVSSWRGLKNLNDYSIGVSLQNRNKEPYTDQQIEKYIEVCKVINDHYNLQEWTGHKNISPGRKTDPHNGFPWDRFKQALKGGNETLLRKVSVSALNMREGAGTAFSVLETLAQNTEVHVLRTENDWSEVLVCHTGRKGWVSSKFIK